MKQARRIVVGVDYEQLGEAALRSALSLASAAGGTELHVVHVRSALEGFPISGRTVEQIDTDLATLTAYAGQVVNAWRDAHGEDLVPRVSAHVTSGRAADALVRTAAALSAGLIVVGTHGRRGLARTIVGSVAGEVVAKARCPVLVVRDIDHDAVEPMADVEAVCEECRVRQAATNGLELWCETHAERHHRASIYGNKTTSSRSIRPWGFGAKPMA